MGKKQTFVSLEHCGDPMTKEMGRLVLQLLERRGEPEEVAQMLGVHGYWGHNNFNTSGKKTSTSNKHWREGVLDERRIAEV